MEHKNKRPVLPFALGAAFSALFLLLIVLVRVADVAAIGPGATKIGLSHINNSFHLWIGFHDPLYQTAKWLGILAIAVAAGIAFLTLWQWIRRKSLWKVDKLLLTLDFLYAVTVAFYLFFELVVVNYRPVLLASEVAPAASFPSSHTLLACSVFGSAFWPIAKYLKQRALKIAAWCASGALLAGTVLCRLFSGVHWLTDILGGLLLGAALICWFWFATIQLNEKE